MRTCICAKWYSQYSVCISYTLILVMNVYDNLVNKMVCLTSHVVNRHCSPYSMASIFVILNGSCYIFLLFRKMFLKNVVSPKKCSWIFFFSEPWRQCTRRAPEWRPWRTARSSSWAAIVAVASTYTVTPLLALACNVACNVACSAGENLCDGNHQPRSRLLPTKKTQRSVAIIDKIDPFPRCTSVRMIATLQSQYND